MSTFLDLCQKLREEAGVSGDGTPVTVAGQTGEMKAIVGWIARAYGDVQKKHPDWDFLRRAFSFQTLVGVNTYTKAGVGLEEVQTWKLDSFRCYLTSAGQIDELELKYVPWSAFRDRYLMNANRNVTGRPIYFTVTPDKSITTFPKPDAVYTIEGECFYRPQVMVADADEPIFPEQFHDVIVWKGLMYYAAFEGAPELYAHGKAEYGREMNDLEADQWPGICTGEPLA